MGSEVTLRLTVSQSVCISWLQALLSLVYLTTLIFFFEVTLRLTVSMSWYWAPLWDLRPDITSCRNVAVWNLRSCIYGAPSLTRGRVCAGLLFYDSGPSIVWFWLEESIFLNPILFAICIYTFSKLVWGLGAMAWGGMYISFGTVDTVQYPSNESLSLWEHYSVCR
jgi:hypothetical protein